MEIVHVNGFWYKPSHLFQKIPPLETSKSLKTLHQNYICIIVQYVNTYKISNKESGHTLEIPDLVLP